MQPNDPMLNHKCRKIAQANCGEGREFWLGELLEPIPGYPSERFCLHVKTHFKEIVFGVDLYGDPGALAVMAQIIHGQPFNPHWLESMEGYFRKRAVSSNGDGGE